MPQTSAPKIGVLAIQGDYERHAAALEEAGAVASLVKRPEELLSPKATPSPEAPSPGAPMLDGLILPGGESTTMLRFLERDNFFDVLKAFARLRPVFGTCAGAILLAKDVRNPSQPSLSILDIAVERNAYGAQRDSAILMLETKLPEWRDLGPLETVFIRAPRIVATGPQVEVLAERQGSPVLVRQGHTMAATFHPELSTDRRVHQLFTNLVQAMRNSIESSK